MLKSAKKLSKVQYLLEGFDSSNYAQILRNVNIDNQMSQWVLNTLGIAVNVTLKCEYEWPLFEFLAY